MRDRLFDERAFFAEIEIDDLILTKRFAIRRRVLDDIRLLETYRTRNADRD